MDVLITPEARREIEALRLLCPEPSTWGILIGHKRGFRYIVEKVFPAGNGRALPDERLFAALDGIWPERIIGLAAVRPGAASRKAVLGPAWYAKLVLELAGTARTPTMRASVVEFERKFFLDPVRFAPSKKEKAHE